VTITNFYNETQVKASSFFCHDLTGIDKRWSRLGCDCPRNKMDKILGDDPIELKIKGRKAV
jgi:hypothetical protein